MKTIDYGIDLGTTNSLIARFNQGQVEVFKNPIGFRETLPSVVAFRNDRIMVGDAARTYAEKDPRSVVSRFKRRMGTSETFTIESIGATLTPTDISALVLKELRTFVRSGELVEAAVITIPASFDTLQSNATREAGLRAGLRQVLLLQEPIAASVAYANKKGADALSNSQWMVYDLGGGTFDVALVKTVAGELTVVDHEGDNYLGGSDFDALIVEKLVVPALSARGKFENLAAGIRSGSGPYADLWPVLLQRAEEAKVELSARPSAEIDLGSIRNFHDPAMLSIARVDYERLIRPAVDTTIEMMKRILARNSLAPTDIEFVLLVGGATYTPFIRSRIQESMGIPVNMDIDPTNAIAVGAAFFAGTRELEACPAQARQSQDATRLKVRVSYNRSSQDSEEPFNAKVEGDCNGFVYRITRDDGAFDSGLRPVTPRIRENLPLRAGAFNSFAFRVFDAQGTPVDTGVESIEIAHGKYSVAGQMLPEDISLVKDDLDRQDTRLACVFQRHTVLPAKWKMTVEAARAIARGSADEIRIMVVEGPAHHHHSTNKPLGVLRIGGAQLARDLPTGAEIDLSFSMSESRDLAVSAYVHHTAQEFAEVFDPEYRSVPVDVLAGEILQLENTIEREQEAARTGGRTELATALDRLQSQSQALLSRASALAADDVTDEKFKLANGKRDLARELFQLVDAHRTEAARAEFRRATSDLAQLVREHGMGREHMELQDLLAREDEILRSGNLQRLEAMKAEVDRLRSTILLRNPEYLQGMFEHLATRTAAMKDPAQARKLIDAGKRHIEAQAWVELRQVSTQLWFLLPESERASRELRFYTGIV
jgi:molecular chaperone DnaK